MKVSKSDREAAGEYKPHGGAIFGICKSFNAKSESDIVAACS